MILLQKIGGNVDGGIGENKEVGTATGTAFGAGCATGMTTGTAFGA